MLDRFELFITSISQIYKCVQKIKSREMRYKTPFPVFYTVINMKSIVKYILNGYL